MPSLAAGMPKAASALAMRISACMAMPRPPPRQKPEMRAITGLGKEARRVRPRLVSFSYSRCASTSLRLFSNWLISAPETNALSPAPVSTTTRTLSSAVQASNISISPSHISTDMALRFSGWLKVIRPTPSVTCANILPEAYCTCSAICTWSAIGSLLLRICAVLFSVGPASRRSAGYRRRSRGLQFLWIEFAAGNAVAATCLGEIELRIGGLYPAHRVRVRQAWRGGAPHADCDEG